MMFRWAATISSSRAMLARSSDIGVSILPRMAMVMMFS